jgi:hypothetical protein
LREARTRGLPLAGQSKRIASSTNLPITVNPCQIHHRFGMALSASPIADEAIVSDTAKTAA